MKGLIRVMSIFMVLCTYAQVGIEKNSVDGDGILDFPSNTTKGIILPGVTSIMAGFSEGTLLFDETDNKVKYFDGTVWQNLTDDVGQARQRDNITLENLTTLDKGVIIGDHTSTAIGVLVLEATDKALILPKVTEPHLKVVNPEAGMICYDTTNHALSVFNGNTWEFWK